MCYLDAMADGAERDYQYHEILKGLLGRGGAALVLAAAAHSRGFCPGTAGQWHVLSPEIQAAAEQAASILAANPDPGVLEQALQSALAPRPMTALPEWLTPVYRDPESLSHIGRKVNTAKLAAALGTSQTGPSDREKGLAATAVALCRLQDTLLTLSSRLPSEQEGRLLARMGRLAYVLTAPGEPSAMRAEIRKIVKGDASWGE